ncbi:MAG: hypothetical protein N2645_17030 [Clostridia bacterium]|nr:hypothetical protein [Clostridia bacterium]
MVTNENNFRKHDIHYSPEDEDIFNASRLLLMFDVLNQTGKKKSISIERISYYDFFSANPLLIFNNDVKISKKLMYEGFPSNTISYISSSHRFVNRLEKLKYYMSYLIARDLIDIYYEDGRIIYSITCNGIDIAKSINTFYSNAYKESCKIIIKHLESMSDTKLSKESQKWLKAENFVIDLIDY